MRRAAGYWQVACRRNWGRVSTVTLDGALVTLSQRVRPAVADSSAAFELDRARGAVQALRTLTISADVAQFELLAAVAKVADGSLSLGETVQRLLDVVVPAFADVAALDAVGDGGELRHLGVRVQAAGADALERALVARHQLADTPLGMPSVIASGKSQLLSPVTDEQLRAMAGNEADLVVRQRFSW